MGKTFRKNKQFLPRKQGKVFTKNSSWKKRNKHVEDGYAPTIQETIPLDIFEKLPL